MKYFNQNIGYSLSLLLVIIFCIVLLFDNIYILIIYLSIISVLAIYFTKYYNNYIYTGIFILLSGGICVFQYYRKDILPIYDICK